MAPLRIDKSLAATLYARADAHRWGVSPDAFADALTTGAGRVFAGRNPAPRLFRAVADRARLKENRVHLDLEGFIANLIDMVTAALTAPVSAVVPS